MAKPDDAVTKLTRESSDVASPGGVRRLNYDELFTPSRTIPLAGRTALVTGASSGIGKATACMLAQEGCNLFLVARREPQLLEIKTEVEKRGLPGKVTVVVGDVSKDETYDALRTAGAYDQVDIIVNNAGLARGKEPVGSALLSDWSEMMDANCLGAFRLVNELLPGMIARGGGHIISTGSIAGLESYENGSVYCASKHALHAFMKCLRYETYAKNIRTTVLAPGFVGAGTEFSEVRFKGDETKIAATYAGMEELAASDVASNIVWVLQQPANVNLDLVHIMPTCQGGATRIHRVAAPSS